MQCSRETYLHNNLLKKFLKNFFKKLLTIFNIYDKLKMKEVIEMKKQKKQKRKVTLETKIIILLNIIVIGILIYKFKINGIAWVSTIGYFD